MVANLIKWPSWTGPSAGTATAKKFQVKLTEMEIDGFADGDGTERIMVIEIKWKGGPKSGRGPFHRPLTKQIKHVSGEAVVKRNEPIKWVDGFENVCNFPIISKDNNVFGPFNVSFNFLYGTKTEAKAKMAVAGKVSVNLGEIARKTEETVASKIPVILNVAGVTREATFSVCMTFVEVRNFPESAGLVRTSTESTQPETTMEDPPQDKKGKQKQKSMEEVRVTESDMSAAIDLEATNENGSNATTPRGGTESCSVSGSETHQTDAVKKTGIFSWKRRRLSFKPIKTKPDPSVNKTANGDTSGDPQKGHNASSPVDSVASHLRQKSLASSEPGQTKEGKTEGQWEEKELKSRDGKATLKASVFFASFHQCSDKAAGESACTALVAVIAHWLLQSSPASIPARSEFDRLIMQGSSEWRRLCDDESLINHFPDKHFDLETVMRSGVRPISVRHEYSFIGFFGPEKFESLRGAMSFDQIWDEIERSPDGDRPRVYIVSWNDHFFVLKVDSDAYYIIDTLGERLYEGCNQAYVIRFDESSLMSHGKKVKGSKEDESEGDEICKGKECCREFIKRFLAAIPLGELEVREKKEPVSYFDLHHRLQIEFNFTSLSSSSSSSCSLSSSPTNSSSSTFSSESVDY